MMVLPDRLTPNAFVSIMMASQIKQAALAQQYPEEERRAEKRGDDADR